MPQDRPLRTGVNWMPERGKLYRFEQRNQTITVIKPWPMPEAWRKEPDQPWRGFVPDVQLRAADGKATTWPHVFEKAAWETVPEPIRRLVQKVAPANRQWKALNLAARVPGALPLMDELPFLAAMLAEVNWLRAEQGRKRLTHPWRAARRHVPNRPGWRGWTRLAAWLGLPTERSFLRVLRRSGDAGLQAWSPSDMLSAVEAWAHPTARKLMQHSPMVSCTMTYLLQSSLQDPAFLHQLSPALFQSAETPDALEDICTTALRVIELRDRANERGALPPLTTLERLERVREDLIARRTPQREVVHMPMPPPPLPPTPHILPLRSDEALFEEGQTMGHCIGGRSWNHLARMRMGFGYAIRIPDGQGNNHRGTLWIAPNRVQPGQFHIEQLQGPGNTTPHESVRQAVVRWLELHTAARVRWVKEGADPACCPVPNEWLEPPCWAFHGDDDIPF